MRLGECLHLRVKDIDFELRTLTLHETKSNRDRVTVLPQAVKEPLRLHLAKVKAQHDEDLAHGYGSVEMPGALARKYPSAEYEWGWQYVFPGQYLSSDPVVVSSGDIICMRAAFRRRFAEPRKRCGIAKPVGPHTFRHPLATHLLQSGTDTQHLRFWAGVRRSRNYWEIRT